MNRFTPQRHSIAIPLIALGLMLVLNACNSRFFWKGIRAYEKMRYPEAIAGFQKSLAQWPNDTMAWRMLGKSQIMTAAYADAQRTFQELDLRTALTEEDRLNWATALMNERQYAEAADVLEPLMVTGEEDNKLANRLWSQCQEQLTVQEDDRNWIVDELRFPNLESTSVPRISGEFLYFSSEPFRWGEPDHRARLDLNETWAMNLNQSNRRVMKAHDVEMWDVPAHDGIICLSPDERAIAYSVKNENGLGWFGDPQEGGYQLMVANRQASGEWGEARPFPFVEKGFVFAHPTWSPDGTKLYFASDIPSPESQGGMDIWVSERNGSFWEEPLNLGPEINSPGDEVYPAFDMNGRLYFASDGHPTLGGLDIFWSEVDPTVDPSKRHWRDGVAWKPPVRMEFPVNTLADDFSIAFEPNGTVGYLSSNRSGMDKIYRISSEAHPVTYEIRVTNHATNEPLPRVPMRWIDSRDGSAWDVRTELDGTAVVHLPKNRAYQVECKLPGFIVERKVLTTDRGDQVWEVKMAKIGNLNDRKYANQFMGGSPFELSAMDWQDQGTQLTRKAQMDLYALADFLKLNPEIFLEIRGHEDASTWDYASNPTVRLSKNRAIEVESFLLRQGVSSKQMISIGKGIQELRNDCAPGEPCAFYQHEENDRVEFRIYGLLQQVPGQIDPVPFTKGMD